MNKETAIINSFLKGDKLNGKMLSVVKDRVRLTRDCCEALYKEVPDSQIQYYPDSVRQMWLIGRGLVEGK